MTNSGKMPKKKTMFKKIGSFLKMRQNEEDRFSGKSLFSIENENHIEYASVSNEDYDMNPAMDLIHEDLARASLLTDFNTKIDEFEHGFVNLGYVEKMNNTTKSKNLSGDFQRPRLSRQNAVVQERDSNSAMEKIKTKSCDTETSPVAKSPSSNMSSAKEERIIKID
ncbi:Gag-pol polyprotein [Caenorhabditis elegans]|nr:Gag-pol polyprotein [Caenorhabditis elegans]CCD70825.1 Gag-pol polyprotein [Caenorhabditis elegans]|eukprot:NP_508103.2 Uncharacterized protein CELE_F52D1.2 [Caenorhabditis elegans]